MAFSFGTAVTYGTNRPDSGGIWTLGVSPDVVLLTPTLAIGIGYGSNGRIIATALAISGTTITAGAHAVVEPANSGIVYKHASRIDNTRALISYRVGGSNTIYVQVLTVSGTTVSVGSGFTITPGGGGFDAPMPAVVSSTRALLVGQGTDPQGYVLTIGTSDVTAAAGPFTLATAGGGGVFADLTVAVIDSTRCLVVYAVGSLGIFAITVDVSTGSAVSGSPVTLVSGAPNTNPLWPPNSYPLVIDGAHALVMVQNPAAVGAVPLTISSTALTVGSLVTENAVPLYSPVLAGQYLGFSRYINQYSASPPLDLGFTPGGPVFPIAGETIDASHWIVVGIGGSNDVIAAIMYPTPPPNTLIATPRTSRLWKDRG